MKMEHVGIIVKDMDESLQFYQEILGLELRLREFLNDTVELAFLYFPEQPSVEVELVWNGESVAKEGIVNHLAFTVDNIDEEINRLRAAGVKLVDEESRSILNNKVKIAFFDGPNGEKLELVER